MRRRLGTVRLALQVRQAGTSSHWRQSSSRRLPQHTPQLLHDGWTEGRTDWGAEGLTSSAIATAAAAAAAAAVSQAMATTGSSSDDDEVARVRELVTRLMGLVTHLRVGREGGRRVLQIVIGELGAWASSV